MELPSQRKVTAKVYTTAGWIAGTFHVPEVVPFLEFLGGDEDFFTLTDVELPRQTSPLPLLALQRHSTALVIPSADEVGPAPESTTVHQVSCLLDGGVVMGSLYLPPDLRVSDQLTLSARPGRRFVVLRRCTVGLDQSLPGKAGVETARLALVNVERVVGVAEM
ncbi:MAG: hypothetical protein AAGF12_13500 [Myxococcota bacterium]